MGGHAVDRFAQFFEITHCVAVAAGVEKMLHGIRQEQTVLDRDTQPVRVQPLQIVHGASTVIRRRGPASAGAYRQGMLRIPRKCPFQPHIQHLTGREVVFIPEPLAIMQPEPRKPDLTGILTEDDSAMLRNSVVLSMNMEEMEMLTAPGESPQKNLMELGEAGFAADQEAPPNQRAHIPKHHSELMKFFHLSSLPNLPRKPHHQTPGFFRSQAASDCWMEPILNCARAGGFPL